MVCLRELHSLANTSREKTRHRRRLTFEKSVMPGERRRADVRGGGDLITQRCRWRSPSTTVLYKELFTQSLVGDVRVQLPSYRRETASRLSGRVWPPSTTIVCPVMYAASFDARNSAA